MQYPIDQNLPQIKSALREKCNLILTAEPGAGKSTVVPLALLKEEWLQHKKILMLQPRRIAAVAVARRMADLSGTRPGKLVGHNVRFSSNTGPETIIEVMTEGILTRRLQKDPTLEDVGLIIFDEFHERSIHSDLCLAICREIQNDLRPDLRLMIMSATMNTDLVKDFLPDCACVAGKGFLHPVETFFQPVLNGRDRFADVASAVAEIVKNSQDNEEYLVFLPGVGEIRKVHDILARQPAAAKFRLVQLHGSMSVDEQQQVLEKSSVPRIILCTNIAETSLTIDGITTVIDSGYCRRLSFNPETGLEQLETQLISRSSAIQRSGRAGRLKPGRDFRLYHQLEFDQMAHEEQPEILRIDPSGAILEVCAWGCRPDEFKWLQKPSESAFKNAIDLLQKLGAINAKLGITAVGKEMVELPANPRTARMLLFAAEKGCLESAAAAAAIISEKDFLLPVSTSSGGNQPPDPDLELRLEILAKPGAADRTTLRADHWQIRRTAQTARQLQQILRNRHANTCQKKNDDILKALLCAFPDRVCMKRSDSEALSYTICSGQGLRLCSPGLLQENELILAIKADTRRRTGSNDGKIFLACRIRREWLKDLVGWNCRSERTIFFSENSQRVAARQRLWYENLLLEDHETSLRSEDSERAASALLDAALKDPDRALNTGSDANSIFLGRLQILRASPFAAEYPELDSEWMNKIIENSIGQCRSFSDLQKLSLEQHYFNQLSWSLKEKFEKLVPERFDVPSGSSIRIDYRTDGPPVLEVKIQELFGMNETPAICGKTQPLLLHLLSPAGRPVQITSDLASFWQNGYKQVISELKGRYPKHPWPDDPQKAIAFKGTKKQFERKTGEKL